MLSFLRHQCHPDMWIKAFLAELQDGVPQMSCVPSALHYNTHFNVFFSLCHFSFHCLKICLSPVFNLLPYVKELDIVRADLLWFIESDLFVSSAAIAAVVMRSDDDGLRSLSIFLSFCSSDELEHAGPV